MLLVYYLFIIQKEDSSGTCTRQSEIEIHS